MAEVTQADREAAARSFSFPGEDGDRVREHVAQLLARHRTEAVKPLVEALKEVEPLLSRLAIPCRADEAVAPEVAALGRSIGYGNLMVTASALWRASLEGQGIAGGEFSANICQKTAENAWLKVCAALRSVQS